MSDTEKLAFRILASLYPDRKPSEIRNIINEALEKEENKDDVSLWMALAKETDNKKDESTQKKEIIEHHYYHHHDYWWQQGGISLTGTTYDSSNTLPKDYISITCDSNSVSGSLSTPTM